MKFRIILIVAFSLFGFVANLACTGEVQTNNLQSRNFVNVDGPSIKAKMDAAIRMGRSNSSTPFWTAYTFDVRPGVSVDADRTNFNGHTMTFSDTSIAIGTSNGVRAETRNLAIFLLREPNNGNITRAEIYNLDRRRE